MYSEVNCSCKIVQTFVNYIYNNILVKVPTNNCESALVYLYNISYVIYITDDRAKAIIIINIPKISLRTVFFFFITGNRCLNNKIVIVRTRLILDVRMVFYNYTTNAFTYKINGCTQIRRRRTYTICVQKYRGHN